MDIDLSAVSHWKPIGTGVFQDPFTGVFDGRGKFIRHLKSKGTGNNGGFFGGLGRGGVLKDINVISGSVTAGEKTGGICGETAGSILRCTYSGVVTGTTCVGGIAGRMLGGSEIADCTFIGPCTGTEYTGGIVGQADTAVVRRNLNEGNVTGKKFTGGIAGGSTMAGTLYVQCRNTGEVRASQENTGGIIGSNNGGTISACHNTGNVTGGQDTGGVSGANFGGGIIKACSNAGNAEGKKNIGGIAGGSENSEIHASRNSGGVKAQGDNAGGITGYSKNTNTFSCYNVGAIKGQEGSGGVIGLSSGNGITAACYSTGFVSGVHPAGVIGQLDSSELRNLFANYWLYLPNAMNGYHGTGWPATGNNVKYFGDTSSSLRPYDPYPSVTTHYDWGIGDGSGQGKYWKDLGSWNNGQNPVFPTLFWE
jgi:hypothetical protein